MKTGSAPEFPSYSSPPFSSYHQYSRDRTEKCGRIMTFASRNHDKACALCYTAIYIMQYSAHLGRAIEFCEKERVFYVARIQTLLCIKCQTKTKKMIKSIRIRQSSTNKCKKTENSVGQESLFSIILLYIVPNKVGWK